MAVPCFTLSSSYKIPAVAYGIGTAWFKKEGNVSSLDSILVQNIKRAIDNGYTHFDAAEIYGTENELGEAIKESKVSRESLFITSKVYNGIDDPAKALQGTLSRLGLSYLDLYLIHAPFKFKTVSDLKTAWKVLEDQVDNGLVKSIGVSNFRFSDLQHLLTFARIKPVVNQIEFHPYLQSPVLAEFCRENNIYLQAYGPLTPINRAAGGPVDGILEEIATEYGKTPSQILLRWAIDKGVIVVTTTSKMERQKEFIDVGDFCLSKENILKIDMAGKALEVRTFWKENFTDQSTLIS